MSEIDCQHVNCTDSPDTTIETESGEQFDLCEDHANDPEKFDV